MKQISILLLIFLLFFSCSKIKTKKEPVDYVDPLLGTHSSRWMLFPGPAMPFGMVKLSPDNVDEWKMDAGYEYTIESISGFGHIHSWAMASFITMPLTGEMKILPGTKDDPDSGYRSRFSHKNEHASPGYYSVILDDYKIKAELTTTTRCGFQRYSYPKDEIPHIIFDLKVPHENRVDLTGAEVKKTADNEISGYASHNSGWNEYKLYFVARFNHPIKKMDGWQEKEILKDINTVKVAGNKDCGVYLTFEKNDNAEVLVKTAISYVSIEQARLNMESELNKYYWDFEAVHIAARNTWNNLLKKIEVQGGTETDKEKFYTNLYRSYCARTIYSDANGKYTDMCEKVQQLADPESPVYGCDAFWNTFWNLNQLWSLVTPDIANKWVKSQLEIYDRGGWLSKGPAGIEYSSIMVASHEIALLVNAYQKGIRNYDAQKAFEAMKKIQTVPGKPHECGGYAGNHNLRSYMEKGFVPDEDGPVSNTLEYAYDDWCVSQMALALNKTDDYNYFSNRSQNYRNVFDPSIKYMRPKHESGAWIEDFVPVTKAHGKEDNFGNRYYIEGNAWQYTWFVPHDLKGLIELLGKDEFNRRLNEGFEKSRPKFVSEFVNHSNQPNMQAAWLFNYSGKPWLTQKWVKEILNHYYGTGPIDGYPGDEDQGQMGAWYVMSAMGLFEMDGGCSVEPIYEISSPIFDKITIHLDNKYYPGKTFVIEAKNNSAQNNYIQSAELNGKALNTFWFKHSDLIKGGKLVLQMGAEPNKNWAAQSELPPLSTFDKFVTTPYIEGNTLFIDKTTIKLKCDTKGSKIYYTADGREPDQNSNLYQKPLTFNKTTTIKVKAFKDGQTSKTNTIQVRKAKLQKPISPGQLKQGITYQYFEAYLHSVNEMKNLKAKKSGTIKNFTLELKEKELNFGFYFKGYIKIPKDGLYRFTLLSNDGAVLLIDKQIAVNMDGLHPAQDKTNEIPLNAGYHPISLKYFQEGGKYALQVLWQGPGFTKEKIPDSVLFHKP